MSPLATLGCDVHATPLPLLERTARRARACPDLAARARARFGVDEAALLLTCNRIELLVAGPRLPDDGALAAAFRTLLDAPQAADGALPIACRRDGAALRHLVRVACSLESAALGEGQILGQVRAAWNAARTARDAGPRLAAAFDLALRVGRKARRETDLEALGVDLPRLALLHLRRELRAAGDAPIALLGTGAMAEALLRARPKEGRGGWLVVSRDARRAADLAAAHGARAAALPDFLADRRPLRALVAATTARAPLLDGAWLAARLAPCAGVVDLGLPRNVAADARGVTRLADLADLRSLAAVNGVRLAATVATIERWIDEALLRAARRREGRPA
jgi:glutamyl-tRNA reductase